MTISNADDIIDSRDVIDRIDELEAIEVIDREPDDQEELDALHALAEQAEGYVPDWKFGEILIRDSYFETYAEQLAQDIGAIDPSAGWPLAHIDWEAAAEALLQDYTSLEFDGVTYWAR